MAEETTLLAYLAPRLSRQGEDAATDAVAFILNNSNECRQEFNNLLKDDEFDLKSIVRFQTQVTYEDGSRPDMDGYDETNKK